jgi:hypothetical protein
MEEWRRNPDEFDSPPSRQLDRSWRGWTLESLLAPNAELADHVPAGAELHGQVVRL